jgi:hypothetical protein
VTELDDVLTGIQSSTVTDAAVLVREVRVRIGVLTKYITIMVYYRPGAEEPFTFELSDLMRTAGAGPARDASRTATSEKEALRHAVRLLTQDYEDAVRRGEMPDDSWLVPVASGG